MPPSYSWPPDWLDEAGAAYLLSLDVEDFTKLVAIGRLPSAVEVGRHKRWSRQALTDAVLAAGEDGLLIPKNPNVYTPKSLAYRWMCSHQHIRNLIRTGHLQAFNFGGKLVRIRPEEVERFERDGFKPVDS